MTLTVSLKTLQKELEREKYMFEKTGFFEHAKRLKVIEEEIAKLNTECPICGDRDSKADLCSRHAIYKYNQAHPKVFHCNSCDQSYPEEDRGTSGRCGGDICIICEEND